MGQVREEAAGVLLLGPSPFNMVEVLIPTPVQRSGTCGGLSYSLAEKTLLPCLSRPQEDLVPAVCTLPVSCVFFAKTN